MATSSKQYKAIGEDLWKGRTEKIVRFPSSPSPYPMLTRRRSFKKNAELFAMTYGALVVQLIQDYEDYAEVNKQLEKMGYNIGTRLIEDFLARSNLGRCADFKETGEVIAKVYTFSPPSPCRSDVNVHTGRLQVVSERQPCRHAFAAAPRIASVEHPCDWWARTADGYSDGVPTVLHAHAR
jgi:hypothetical protein